MNLKFNNFRIDHFLEFQSIGEYQLGEYQIWACVKSWVVVSVRRLNKLLRVRDDKKKGLSFVSHEASLVKAFRKLAINWVSYNLNIPRT